MKQTAPCIPHSRSRTAEMREPDDAHTHPSEGGIHLACGEAEPHPLMQMLDHFGGRRSSMRVFLEGECLDEWN